MGLSGEKAEKHCEPTSLMINRSHLRPNLLEYGLFCNWRRVGFASAWMIQHSRCFTLHKHFYNGPQTPRSAIPRLSRTECVTL
jgi:hypothetical protein